MVREQLFINGTEVEIKESLNPNLTFSIQDITKPDKRKATFSKSINLPGSKTINELFNFIFEINISGSFNPNLKATAKYLVDGEMVLDGFLQLKDIKYLDNSDISYEVVLLGSIANVFNELGELELTDIQDLDDFNHNYTDTQQALTWATSYPFQGGTNPYADGEGFIYPMINYGFDNSLDSYSYDEMYPAFFAKELFDRIFTDSGYTYSSTFLSSNDAFIKGIIPFNGLKFGQSSSTIANKEFTANTPSFDSSMVGQTGTNTSVLSFVDVSDPGGVHNAGIFTAPATGVYSFKSDTVFNAKFIPDPTAGESTQANFYLKVEVILLKNSTAYASRSFFISTDRASIAAAGSLTTNASPSYPDSEYLELTNTATYVDRNFSPPNKIHVSPMAVPMDSGDTAQLFVKVTEVVANPNLFYGTSYVGAKFYNSTNETVYDGTWDLYVTTGNFANGVVNTEYGYNDVVDMQEAVPQDIKQRDYVMSIINMFNLFVEQDKDNPTQYNIEPRDTFYTAEVIDYSKKLDVSQDLVITPMGLLDAGRYKFTYKPDKDYYNELYTQTYNKTYGEREITVNNDFIKNENKNEIIFSPTPLVGQTSNDRVVSTIIKTDSNNQAQRTDSNIRYLIYDGLKATASTWNHYGTQRTTYPYVGHFDDPFNPTFDVNFGLPQEIYYDDTFNTITLTDANLYNVYHRKQLEEVIDKDSKIVKGMFYLTPNDISNLSFRPQYWFNNAYHRLLKVVNYNPANVNLTECYFLKLEIKDSYTTVTQTATNAKNATIGSGSGSIEEMPVKNLYQNKINGSNSYDAKQGSVEGSDNYVGQSVKNFSIVGNDNNVGEDSENISISGNGNLIGSSLYNVTLINTNDVTVTESNVTYIDGKQTSGAGSIVQKSTDFTVDLSVLGYEIDTSASGVKATFPTAVGNDGNHITFKKVSTDGNNIELTSAVSETFDDNTSVYLTSYNDLVVVYSNGTNWKIR